jgi:AP-1 complex subunit gamma-1
MSTKLRDLIRSVRSCKTAAEERALISREKALIRNSFTEDEADFRARNIAKLLYINMLGHDTDFGQMECLKLLTSSTYSDKKIGYLGLTQLFNEKSEVLMMATHRIRIDLQNNTHFVVSLALAALSEIATMDMCRELASEVAKLMSSSPNYIKKKASLAATRIIRKVPEAIDDFIEKIQGLMEERHHGVMLSTLALVEEILQINLQYKTQLKKHIPLMVRVLKSLASSYTAEYDVSGIIDPFLQIAILKAFRIMGTNDEAISEEISEILAQVATNTPSNKNTGNAVLFECVKTIMNIESSNTLKTVAINILGKFLGNKDSNSKYVALQALQKVCKFDLNAVQKHKQIILDCLKENDLSVKRLALELLYHITNENNISSIVREMLNYLLVSETEFLQDLTLKICSSVEKFAPDRRWHIDTITKVLTLAGNYVKDESVYSVLHLIAGTPELQIYSIHKLFFALKENMNQDGLAKVGFWCIGEFSHHLVDGNAVGPDGAPIRVSEEEVLDLIEKVLDRINLSELVREFALNCLVKLYAKFKRCKPKIRQLIDSQTSSPFLEVQQRACEYLNLLQPDWDNLRADILDTMPPCSSQKAVYENKPKGDTNIVEVPPGPKTANNTTTTPAVQPKTGEVDFLNFDMTGTTTTTPVKPATTDKAPADDLFNIFSNPAPTTTTTAPPTSIDINALYTSANVMNTGNPMNNLMFNNIPNNNFMFNPGMNTGMNQMQGGMNFNTGMAGGVNYNFANMNSVPTINTAPTVTTNNNNNSNAFDLLGGFATVSPTVSPSALTIKAFSDDNLEITFTCTKDAQDTTGIQANFSNKSGNAITDLVFQAAVMKHLKLTMNPISGTKIQPNARNGVSQTMKIVNSMQGQKAIVVKLKISYNINGQQVAKDQVVNEFPATY